MRYKLRGKSIVGWCHGSYVYSQSEDAHYIIEWDDEEETSFTVDGETVGQYIGLKDKNGNDIYEGDITKRTHQRFGGVYLPIVELQVIKGRIIWAEQVGKFMLKDTDNNTWDFKQIQTNECLETIGNIHDNPELLGEEDE